MAEYDVTGSGVISLTSGVTRLFVEVLVFPVETNIGRATPTNYYDLALLRVGVEGAYGPVIPVDAAQIFVDLPTGTTSLGYSIFGIGELLISESTPPPPVGTDISTDHDGGSCTDGDTVVITFERSSAADPGDWVAIVDQGWNDGYGAAFLYSAPHPCYTNSGADTPGSGTVQSGAFSVTIADPFGTGNTATLRAVYWDGLTGSTIATSTPTISFSN
jgi:hypothetical protein